MIDLLRTVYSFFGDLQEVSVISVCIHKKVSSCSLFLYAICAT